jgi:hypothetical protein
MVEFCKHSFITGNFLLAEYYTVEGRSYFMDLIRYKVCLIIFTGNTFPIMAQDARVRSTAHLAVFTRRERKVQHLSHEAGALEIVWAQW